jgi:cysteinyl-tRNA synthetase
MHNEMLQVEGKKMSKSLGNFFTVRDLLDQGVPGEVIRFVMLSTHYRKPMDWTAQKAREATNTLRQWAEMAGESSCDPNEDILDCLCDDLMTSDALRILSELADNDEREQLNASAMLLGFDLRKIAASSWAKPFSYQVKDGSFRVEGVDFQPTVGVIGWGHIDDRLRDACLRVVRNWLSHRRHQDWEAADLLKSAAMELGVELRATKSKNGINSGIANLLVSELDAAEIEALQ